MRHSHCTDCNSSSRSPSMNTSRRALLVLDLQKEFLDPSCGRCLLPGASLNKNEQPDFLQNIELLLTRFRQLNGDIVWVRSLAQGKRDFTDVRVEETVLVINSDDEESADEGGASSSTSGLNGDSNDYVPRIRRAKKGLRDSIDEKGSSRSPLSTDAYLSVDTCYPPVSPDSPGSEWAVHAIDMMNCPPDWVMQKSWYSAFKDTTLLDQLRGRFVTQLYICGLMTNVGILATAADAARHGFETRVLSDCVGYRSQAAHDRALLLMENAYGVENSTSRSLLRASTRGNERNRSGPTPMAAVGATAISRDELAALVQELKLNAPHQPLQVPTRDASPSVHKQTRRKAQEQPIIQLPGTIPTQYMTKSSEFDGPLIDDLQPGIDKLVTDDPTVERKMSNSDDTTVTFEEAKLLSKNESTKNGTQRKLTKNKSDPLKKYKSTAPVLGVGDRLGEGDSYIICDLLPEDSAGTVFETLKNEVAWRSMFHRGGEVPRLVAVQGQVADDGSFPIYRHPADESPPLLPFSPTVEFIRRRVESILEHKVNHVLIQHYRHGNDYISEHSDKTIDIARGSKIVNVSIGAQRTMCLRTKKDKFSSVGEDDDIPKREMQRIPLPHNSMFVLGLETNKKWLHGIKQDRRMPSLKSGPELSYNGERISLTFRHIETYLSGDEKIIWGQGAIAKTKDGARPVINGESTMTEKFLEAFGKENHNSEFSWDAFYGTGFDVLHFQEPLPKLLAQSTADAPNARVKICLHEINVKFREEILSKHQLQSLVAISPRGETPVLIDTDPGRTTLHNSLAILQYLERCYSPRVQNDSCTLLPSIKDCLSYGVALSRMMESEILLQASVRSEKEKITEELELWNNYLKKDEYAGGKNFSLVDIALYPVLCDITKDNIAIHIDQYPEIERWMNTIAARESVKKVYGLPLIKKE
ncbi:hypothetical protein EDC01DRAFT_640420 [Geopyxis carbonaria]|nr:hypothetical protein EDC01DRAFT_640420 [Geopyxis carbonaria]